MNLDAVTTSYVPANQIVSINQQIHSSEDKRFRSYLESSSPSDKERCKPEFLILHHFLQFHFQGFLSLTLHALLKSHQISSNWIGLFYNPNIALYRWKSI